MRQDDWKTSGLGLATTLSMAYVLCAVFDALFPPYGLLRLLAPVSPWPIEGNVAGFVTGFAMFAFAGFGLGAFHALAQEFWSERLKRDS